MESKTLPWRQKNMQRVPFEPPTDHYDKLVFIECKIALQKPTN